MSDVSLSVLGLEDAELAAIARELAGLIRGEVRFGRHDRMLYSTDASLYQVEPLGVVIPRDRADAEAAVRFCAERGLPILPRGGGTSLAGQAVNRAIVIDFSVHCRELIEVDVQRRIARVQPGIVPDHLNAALAKHGLMFGPDVATGSHANIGGMIGNNSAGAHSILYGRTVEHLLGMDVMLSDGAALRLEQAAALRDERVRALTQQVADVVLPIQDAIDQRYPKITRHVDGYNLDLMLQQLRASSPGTLDQVNLAHLICGSEGTLAVMLEATIGLVPAPKHKGLAIVGFESIDAALRSLTSILQTSPAAVELIDEVVIDLARHNIQTRRYVELLPRLNGGDPGAVLYVAYFAESPAQLQRQFQTLADAVPGRAMSTYTGAQELNQAWRLRKSGEPLLHGLHGPRKPLTFVEDLAVDPAKLADFVQEFRALTERHGTRAAYYAHASVGCLHMRPLVNVRDPADRELMQKLVEEATELVIRYGGALSGEHGDGRLRSHLLQRYFGREICDAFAKIKAIFDPRNLLNPGNIVAPQPMLEHLRVKPASAFVGIPDVKTFYRYEPEHGFAEAVEMCNGAGVCRRMTGGTMCPSYRATLDERHATRGRGNALRLAISGQFSPDATSPRWDDEQTLQTLDLCLSCKACKSECPSNVDIAKLKSEYHAQRFAASGVSLATRLLGNVRKLNRMGSAMPGAANLSMRIAPIRRAIEKLLGVSSERSLPEFGTSLFRWKNSRGDSNGERPVVILLPDCFHTYNEPHVGRAAVQVLEAFGYRVVLPKIGCCGRAMISLGMLADAVKVCSRTAADLIAAAEESNAVAIVGLEPSCVSAIIDDWTDLKLTIDASRVRTIADMTFSIEDFLERNWSKHPIRPRLTQQKGDTAAVLLHGHCHQKALWGMDATISVLKRCVHDRLRPLETGCCGMAGAFGYAAHRYDLSMRIGELDLFPAVRAEPDAIIVAPGTSCRHQIRDGTGRSAIHPIELIAAAISP